MELIQTIIQGGAVGISVLLILVYYKTVSNHIAHDTEAKLKLMEAITKLTGSVDNNTASTNRLVDKEK